MSFSESLPLQSTSESARLVSGVKPPNSFTLGSNLLENWKIFKQRWHTYAILSQLDKQPREVQVALFLHTLADDSLKVYNGFHFSTPEDSRTVDQIIEKFDQFAVGEINETYERYLFNNRKQIDGERFDKFLSDLRSLIKTCSYCDNCQDSVLRDRIVLGISDSLVQTELLKVRNLTLARCIDICKASENATLKNKVLRPDNSVDKINLVKKGQGHKPDVSQKSNFSDSIRSCKFCTFKHEMRKEKCPAYGKQCPNCLQFNHFSSKCPNTKEKKVKSKSHKSKNSKSAKVHQIANDSDSSADEWINVCKDSVISKDVKCKMQIGGRNVIFQIDTGASVNTLPIKYAKNIKQTTKVISTWNNAKQIPIGTCRRSVTNPKNQKKYSVEFVVCNNDFTPLLSLKASQQMGLVEICDDNFERVYRTNIENSFDDVTSGKLGNFSGEQHLNVNDAVPPVIMPDRRVPIALRSKLKDELDRLVNLGVIKAQEEPTPWLSQLVVATKKSGDIRICLDPKELNKALLREHFTLPILEDTLHELGQSKVFSKADLSSGYWHVILDEESSKLTTFQTCFGRYRWLRLPFGLCVSSEIFQKRMLECFQDLPGIVCIADDVIIHGKDTDDHDKNLELFFKRCRENNISLNKDKLVLRTNEVTFMGHVITSDGLKSDPVKMQAIRDFPIPQKIDELRRFLGMVNYMSKFLPNSTEILHPLYNLLKKDVVWTWSESQDNAFQQIKDMIVDSPVLSFYDPTKELTLENDASEYGLGSALIQEGRPIAFSSRSLSSAERNYASIEKEMLAIVHGLTKYHHFTFGRHVSVVTDHKPLVAILNKPLFRAPKRLQAMLLRLQEYNFQLTYKPGKSIPIADALSRAPSSKSVKSELVSVNNLSFTPIKESRLKEIRDKTNGDETLQLLKNTIMHGWPDHKTLLPMSLTPYFVCRDELTVQDGIILRGERIVIPASLRREMKEKIHAGHAGINSCLRRARDLIYWPGISAEIRQYVESCNTCASYSSIQSKEPLHLHDTPSRPWEKIGTDIFTISGRNYLVTVDYYSQFFEIDFLQELNSESVITKLKHHFCRYGIPNTVISDNGPQYSSLCFHNFAKEYGFAHEPISPGNSQSNGAAEAAVKIAKNLMKKCLKAKEDPYLGLLNLRNTPHEGMKTSPAQRLFGRRTKTCIPTIAERLKPLSVDFENETKNRENNRQKVAERYISRKSLKPLNVGEIVRMQPIQKDKDEWKEAVVTKRIKNRSYEVTANGKTYRRNRRFLRRSVESRKIEPTLEYRNAGLPDSLDSNDQNVERDTGQNSNNESIPSPTKVPYSTAPSTLSESGGVQTRSGRIVKPPDRLDL